MKQIFSESLGGTTQKNVVVPAGTNRRIEMRFSGTNNNGQVGTRANCGTVKVYLNGKVLTTFSPSKLWEMNYRQRRGNERFTSTDNSTFDFLTAWNFGGWLNPNDGNVCHFGDDELKLEFNYTNPTATVFASLTLTVSVEEAFGIESYFPIPGDYDITSYTSRPAKFRPTSGFSNLLCASLDYVAGHTEVVFLKGENAIYDELAAVANLRTNLQGHLATYTPVASLVPYIYNFALDGLLQGVLHPDYRLGVINSSAAAATGLIVRAEYRRAKNSLTASAVQANRERRLQNDPSLAGAI